MPLIRFVATLLAALLASSPAWAALERWDFRISEDQVRNGPEADGSTDSPATGWGHFVYDTTTQTLDYTISWNDLQDDLTKLHIHGPAAPGENNPNHLIEIFNSLQDVLDAGADPRTGQVTGSVALDGAATLCEEIAGTVGTPASSTRPCLLEGLAYVNVHTAQHPMGEIRGNLALQPPVIAWAFDISEGQVRNGSGPDGSTDSPASGRGSLRYTIDTGQLDYTISWDGLEDDLIKLHVHGPADAASSNPTHLFEIFNSLQDVLDAGVDPRSGAYTASISMDATATECTNEGGDTVQAAPGALVCFLEERAYVNVHSAADPMGEIRGNLVTMPPLMAWVAPFSEAQVRNGSEPDGSTDSAARGSAMFRYDSVAERLYYHMEWRDLEEDLTKLHVHGPADAGSSNPNHLFEIFNSIQDVLDAGVGLRTGSYEGSIPVDVGATDCTDESGDDMQAAPGALPCFLDEQAYVNVHTVAHPMGEIRGNLRVLPHPFRWLFRSTEAQVKNGDEPDGSTNSAATGNNVMVYDAGTQSLSYAFGYDGLEGDLTKLHVHGPAEAGASNPTHQFEIFNSLQDVLDAGADLRSDTVFGDIHLDRTADFCVDVNGTQPDASPGALACFLEERGYVNVHSGEDPMGEIRGNTLLVPEPGLVPLAGLAAASVATLGLRRRLLSKTGRGRRT